MLIKIENVEIRGCEIKESRKTGSKFLVVRFEDETGKAETIVDRDTENQPYYKRGLIGDIYADLDITKTFTKFEMRRFQAAEGQA